jgi:hypothetical protein
MTLAEYLAWETQQPIKHEYIKWKVYTMVDEAVLPNDITLKIVASLQD